MAENLREDAKEKPQYRMQIVWINVFNLTLLHLAAVYGIYLGFTSANRKTFAFAFFYATLGGLGITAGCHRLWAHRSYKARFPLRVLLCILSTIAVQNDIHEWCRDHRVHHKFVETDADPHSITRGFFFAHMGWLMCRKHPDVTTKGKTLKLDDLLEDPVVRFQRRFYMPMVLFLAFYLPAMIPCWMWNESLWNSFFIASLTRYCVSLHLTWLINSAAHTFGTRPYDRSIAATENAITSFFAFGEGWHNYHHAFPWDYAASELGYTMNFTKLFIDFMGLLGMAYDLKTATPEIIKRRKETSVDQSGNPWPVDMNFTSKD